MKILILFKVLFLSCIFMCYGQHPFKSSGVSPEERRLILEELNGTTSLEEKVKVPLFRWIQDESISMVRIYSTMFHAGRYDFNKSVYPLLEITVEQIWFIKPTKNGDSVIGSCELGKGKYQYLELCFQGEPKRYRPVRDWLRKEKGALSNKTLIFIGATGNWHVIDEKREVRVLKSGRLVNFADFYRKEFGTIEKLRKSFAFG